MIRTAVIACLVLLGACTDQGAARRAYLQSFVGRPQTELIRAMGVPTRTYDAEGRRFIAYDDRRLDVLTGPAFPAGIAGWGGYGFAGLGFYSGFPTEVVERGCETTFEIARDVVQGWQLRGNACP